MRVLCCAVLTCAAPYVGRAALLCRCLLIPPFFAQLMYSDLDERNTSELSKFDASVALEILEHYCSGDLSQVRNRRAYLAGAGGCWAYDGSPHSCRAAAAQLAHAVAGLGGRSLQRSAGNRQLSACCSLCCCCCVVIGVRACFDCCRCHQAQDAHGARPLPAAAPGAGRAARAASARPAQV